MGMGDDPRSWVGLEGPAPAGPPGPLAGPEGRAGARPSNGRPRGKGDDPRSWAWGTIHDHGLAWRVRLLPDLLARPRARKAARERGPPTDGPAVRGMIRDHGHGGRSTIMGWPGGSGSCRTSWPARGPGRPRGSAALQRTAPRSGG